MSRETDSSSSGPKGRGGAAYPSGTPPYGTPTGSEGGADAGRSAGDRPEERKTETRLTTRVRINIPGSRPIPPVVVRTPVADAEGSDNGTNGSGSAAAEPPPTASSSAPGSAEHAPASSSGPAAPAEEKASDWFVPRKSGAPHGGPGGGGINGAQAAGTPGGLGAHGSGPGTPAGVDAGTPSGPGVTGTGGARPGGSGAGGRLPTVPGPRPGGANGPTGAGRPGAGGTTPVAPGHGGGTGSFDVSSALAAGPLGHGSGAHPTRANGAGDGDEASRRHDPPYFSDFSDIPENGGVGLAGPTGGPVTGEGPLAPHAGAGGPGGPGGPGGLMDPYGYGGPGGPGAPGGGPGRPGGGLSDDTAILTPQKPAPEPPGFAVGIGENFAGDTLTSHLPDVPPPPNSPFGPGVHVDGPLPHQPPKLPEPVSPAAPAAAKPKKKGRSKLMLLGIGMVVLGGGVYGAGLLMNHSDVPKGTTVLGVDIGGGTRDEAVKKLDEAFGKSTDQALKLTVGGETVSLQPDRAGLQFDSQATVRAAAGSDYNPVSVVGSLFGNERIVAPVMPVDEEKLRAALEREAGGSGSATDGTINFESGKAVAVYGKAGEGIDVNRSAEAVEAAYRTQVETGRSDPVKVSTTTREPTISKAEVDRKMKAFAEPAMSGIVTVRAGTAEIAFSPEKSIYKFLTVRAVEGKLVEHYNLDVLKELYGDTFDGVLITKGNGSKKPVSPEEVASAVGRALRGSTPAERIVTIPTDPS